MRIEFRDVRLDRLLEERDHLKIRINLMQNNDTAVGDTTHAQALLADLEKEITDHKRALNA